MIILTLMKDYMRPFLNLKERKRESKTLGVSGGLLTMYPVWINSLGLVRKCLNYVTLRRTLVINKNPFISF